MIEPSDTDLIDYLLKRLPPQRASEIRTRSSCDQELAAQLQLMAQFIGLPLEGAERMDQPKAGRSSRFRGKSLALGVLLVLGLTGLGWAAYSILVTPPLLTDNFNDGWLDVRLWRVVRRSVMEENGYVRLMNRGILMTKAEFREPISLNLDWRWIDHAGEPLYADNFGVILRTAGRHNAKHSYEMQDGVLVQFNCLGGVVSIYTLSAGPRKLNKIAGTADGTVPLPAGAWHHIRITDDGETVSVFVKGPAIDPKYAESPVVRVKIVPTEEARHIAFYNRELLASAVHESHIDNVTISVLKQDRHLSEK